MMRSNMTINVEFLAGTELKEALTEAKEKALKLDVAYVCFKFNDVDFSIGRDCDIYETVEIYENKGFIYSICAA